MSGRGCSRKGGSGGSSLVEFALVALLFCFMLLAFVEFGRMLLVYNSVANSAKEGVRYAIVHGNGNFSRAGSGPTANPPDVVAVVKNFAGSAPLNGKKLTFDCSSTQSCVDYPDGSNNIGARVRVKVVYPYDPLVGYFPLSVNLGSVSEGRIAF